jgi:hypothetical protein
MSWDLMFLEGARTAGAEISSALTRSLQRSQSSATPTIFAALRNEHVVQASSGEPIRNLSPAVVGDVLDRPNNTAYKLGPDHFSSVILALDSPRRTLTMLTSRSSPGYSANRTSPVLRTPHGRFPR